MGEGLTRFQAVAAALWRAVVLARATAMMRYAVFARGAELNLPVILLVVAVPGAAVIWQTHTLECEGMVAELEPRDLRELVALHDRVTKGPRADVAGTVHLLARRLREMGAAVLATGFARVNILGVNVDAAQLCAVLDGVADGEQVGVSAGDGLLQLDLPAAGMVAVLASPSSSPWVPVPVPSTSREVAHADA